MKCTIVDSDRKTIFVRVINELKKLFANPTKDMDFDVGFILGRNLDHGNLYEYSFRVNDDNSRFLIILTNPNNNMIIYSYELEVGV